MGIAALNTSYACAVALSGFRRMGRAQRNPSNSNSATVNLVDLRVLSASSYICVQKKPLS